MVRATVLGTAVAVAGALLAAGPVAAAERLVSIDTPSVNVDPATVRFNGTEPRLRANVVLPDGYDGERRFPVLFLLHGAGDNYSSWASAARGDILNTARGLGAIIVMPEAATGFYSNWWNGGRRGRPGWERFYSDELVPLIERRFRVLPGRRWHAIAGLSMGGMGATFLASQLPGYFGTAATFSGFVQHQRVEAEQGLTFVSNVNYGDIFGPLHGFYATGHNPTRLTDNLRSTRLYVTVGSGVAEPDAGSSPSAVVGGGAVETELRQQADELVAAARSSGVDTTYRPENGVHDWPYWRRHLREAISWGLFGPVAESPANWTYRTVAQARRGVGPSILVRLAARAAGDDQPRRHAAAGSGVGHGNRPQLGALRVHRQPAIRARSAAVHLWTTARPHRPPAASVRPHDPGARARDAPGRLARPSRARSACADRTQARSDQQTRPRSAALPTPQPAGGALHARQGAGPRVGQDAAAGLSTAHHAQPVGREFG